MVTIGNIRGVLDSSVLDPEPGPQGPFITYSYYVTYDFVEDEEGEGSEYGGVLAEVRLAGPGRGAALGPRGFPQPLSSRWSHSQRLILLSLNQGAPQFLHQAMSPTPPPSPGSAPPEGGGVWFTRRRRAPSTPQIVKPTPSENEPPEEARASLTAPAAPAAPAGTTAPAGPAASDTAEEAEDSAESAPSSASQSVELEESGVSGGSLSLPGSLGSAEELAQLRPRMDLRLCPSPG